jgi:hypothetical protein
VTRHRVSTPRKDQPSASGRSFYVYLKTGDVDVVPLVSRTEITNDRVILHGIIEGMIAADYARRDVYCAGDLLMSPAC